MAKKDLTQLIEQTDTLRKNLEKKRQAALAVKKNQVEKAEPIPEVEGPRAESEENIKNEQTNNSGDNDIFGSPDAFQQQNSFNDSSVFGNQYTKSPFDDLTDATNVFGGAGQGSSNFFCDSASPPFAQQPFDASAGRESGSIFDDVSATPMFGNNASHSLFGDADDAWIGDFGSGSMSFCFYDFLFSVFYVLFFLARMHSMVYVGSRRKIFFYIFFEIVFSHFWAWAFA